MQEQAASHFVSTALPPDIDINDPRLSAPIYLAVAPGIESMTPEEIEAGLAAQAPERPPELHNPESRSLFALGLHDKAYRRSYCGATQYRRCHDHPEQMRKSVRTCMTRTCFSCILRQADVTTARLRKRHRNLFRVEKYSMIHITGAFFETVPSHDEILSWRESLSDILRDGLDPRPGTGALSQAIVEEVVCSRKHFRLVATVLWWGRLEEATLDSLAAISSELTVTQHSPSTFYENFHEMLCYSPPTSPDDCALLEQSLEGIRMLRTQGQMMRKDILNPEDALDIAHEELIANGMADKCQPVPPESAPEAAPICCRCHKPLAEVSEWVPAGRKVTDFDSLHWHLEQVPMPPG